MISSFSVAIYPNAVDAQWQDIQDYIHMAKAYGCKEVFSSAHLPEHTLQIQLQQLSKLAQLVKLEQMELTVDFGGSSLYEILNYPMYQQMIKDMKIDFIRLDYGYEIELMKRIVDELDITGFVWNASIMSEQDILDHLHFTKKLYNIRIRACHNFYPRVETGLDESFLQQQNMFFQRHSIPVTTCLAYLDNARGPLNEGLPTLEKHRKMPLSQAIFDCMKSHSIDSILFGDEFLSEAAFQTVNRLLQHRPFMVHIRLCEDVTKEERHIVCDQIHQIRYDSNAYVLRCQSSRQMAEFATPITPNHTVKRDAYCITIDNEQYQRYSGELQIVLQPLPQDNRVNVIGHIEKQDIWKLDAYKEGFNFQFIVI